MPSLTLQDVRTALEQERAAGRAPVFRSAVLLTLLSHPLCPMELSPAPEPESGGFREQGSPHAADPTGQAEHFPSEIPAGFSDSAPDTELHLLYEQRAFSLKHQPGEVCFPGGAVEKGETPEEAAIREACEELLIRPEQITVLGPLGLIPGPRNSEVHTFVGVLKDYPGTFSRDEVERVFTIPLSWLLKHPPAVYQGYNLHVPGEDFPVELIPGGRNYRWSRQSYPIPVYHGTSPVLWGFTARVTDRFCQMMKNRSSL